MTCNRATLQHTPDTQLASVLVAIPFRAWLHRLSRFWGIANDPNSRRDTPLSSSRAASPEVVFSNTGQERVRVTTLERRGYSSLTKPLAASDSTLLLCRMLQAGLTRCRRANDASPPMASSTATSSSIGSLIPRQPASRNRTPSNPGFCTSFHH